MRIVYFGNFPFCFDLLLEQLLSVITNNQRLNIIIQHWVFESQRLCGLTTAPQLFKNYCSEDSIIEEVICYRRNFWIHHFYIAKVKGQFIPQLFFSLSLLVHIKALRHVKLRGFRQGLVRSQLPLWSHQVQSQHAIARNAQSHQLQLFYLLQEWLS